MRLFAATLRFALGAALLGSVAWQIIDRTAHHVFRPHEYFTYFTVDTSMATGILMLIAGAYALRATPVEREPRWLSLARLGLVTSSVIVAVVYNLLLRNLPPLAAFLVGTGAGDAALAEAAGLRAVHFFRVAHRQLWEGFGRIRATGQSIDAVTVRADLETAGTLDGIGDVRLVARHRFDVHKRRCQRDSVKRGVKGGHASSVPALR